MSKFIAIKLLNSKAIWHPGETILGEVSFTAQEQADVQTISITMKGKTKARYTRSNGQSSRRYTSKVSLFRFNKILFKGPFTISPGQMSWPFEFTIPMDCRHSVGEKGHAGQYFCAADNQPLPPTFMASSYHKDCSIEYTLEAEMQTSKTFATNRNTSVMLRIAPARNNEVSDYRRRRYPRSFTVQSLHLDPQIDTRSLTFKEKMRTAFKTETLPKSFFSVSLDLPEAVAVRSPIEAYMYLQHNVERTTATELPMVYLKTLSVTLKFDVVIQTVGMTSCQIQNWSESMPLGQWSGKEPLIEKLDLSALFTRGLGIGWNVAPAFKTYNISVNYRLKIKYTVECATKTLDAEHSQPVALLGLRPADLPAGQSGNQSDGLLPPPIEQEEQLPAYQKSDEAGAPVMN